jgi:hypothetical protein
VDDPIVGKTVQRGSSEPGKTNRQAYLTVMPIPGRRLFIFAFSLLIPAFAAGPDHPPRFVLVGDSTVAPVNGWGPGFCALLTNGATCLNLARNGRSSGSYRAEGLWAGVMNALKEPNDASRTWVLIQFGHNDQPGKSGQPGKPGRSTDLATEIPANMKRYVREVRAAGESGFDYASLRDARLRTAGSPTIWRPGPMPRGRWRQRSECRFSN